MIGYETTNFILSMESITIALGLYVMKGFATMVYHIYVSGHKADKEQREKLNELLGQVFWDDLVVIF